MAQQVNVVNVGRRTWNKDEYLQKAQERDGNFNDDDGPAPITRELLKTRDEEVDLLSKLGKTSVVNPNAADGDTGQGYYCKVCECTIKDSASYLDHINGRKHNRNLGMSMRVERSTLDQVKARLEFHKTRPTEKKRSLDVFEKIKMMKAEEEEERERKRQKRKEKKKKEKEAKESKDNGDAEGGDDAGGEKNEADEMMAMMGLPSGFSTSKK